jgi:hypothetical protein
MTSERVQRRIDRLLEQADEALDRLDWNEVRVRAEAVLSLEPENRDAVTYLEAARRNLKEVMESTAEPASEATELAKTYRPGSDESPASFASGRYIVKKFLGEGGKKRVYLAHDTLLDRDVAFARSRPKGWTTPDATASRARRTRWAGWARTRTSSPSIDLGEEPPRVPGTPRPGRGSMNSSARPTVIDKRPGILGAFRLRDNSPIASSETPSLRWATTTFRIIVRPSHSPGVRTRWRQKR